MAGIVRARAVVVTIPDPSASRKVVRLCRSRNADVRIIVRTRYIREVEELRRAGGRGDPGGVRDVDRDRRARPPLAPRSGQPHRDPDPGPARRGVPQAPRPAGPARGGAPALGAHGGRHLGPRPHPPGDGGGGPRPSATCTSRRSTSPSPRSCATACPSPRPPLDLTIEAGDTLLLVGAHEDLVHATKRLEGSGPEEVATLTTRPPALPLDLAHRFPDPAPWSWPGRSMALARGWIRLRLPADGDRRRPPRRRSLHPSRRFGWSHVWLGPFDESSLSKGPFLPLSPPRSPRRGFPCSGRGLYTGPARSSSCSVRFHRPTNATRFVLFAILVLNPVVVTRAVREGIYPALTLLVLAGGVGVFSSFLPRIAARQRRQASAVSRWGFWLTREEGIWIVPSVTLLLVAAIFRGRGIGAAPRLLRAVGIARPSSPASSGPRPGGGPPGDRRSTRPHRVRADDRRFTPPTARSRGSLPSRKPWSRSRRRLEKGVRAETKRSEARPYLEGQCGAAGRRSVPRGLPDTAGEIAGGWTQFALREAAAMRGATGPPGRRWVSGTSRL